ncbi:MAG: bifunctional metallophosphatase/5'-nucleotidase [Saccharofermentanales bacterium]|jgi:5'-nucleotidase/UDP-sugar diphosphatase
MDIRRLVLLHSNDMHGDFFAKESREKLVGGLSRLSGYVHKVREEEEDPVLYVISGDMLQGSIIDQEYKGISTILLMNMLEPDVVTLGNHETDYGFSHLMFLERCAKFPIVNANLFLRPTGTNLFRSYLIKEVDGIRLLFIGIITEEVIHQGQNDPLVGSFISIEDAAREVEYICNSYKDVDIDFTVLLTHIGFEQDKELAAILPPEIGVDLIIGGHSHTMLEQPEKVNDILIAQVGSGTEYIGRFDIDINMDTNSVHDFTWRAIPIDNTHCPEDPVIDELLNEYQEEVDGKYNTVMTRLSRDLEHLDRFRETEVGDLMADIMRYQLGVDVAFIASGAIRQPYLHRLVTRAHLMELFPYDEPMISFSVSGERLIEMIQTLMHRLYAGDMREFYQWSANLRAEIGPDGDIEMIQLDGLPIKANREIRVAMQSYHFNILNETFGVTHESLADTGKIRVVSTSGQDNIIEYFRTNQVQARRCDGRIRLETPIPKI